MSFVKTITIFFTFQRHQCLLSRLSQSSLLLKDFNVFCQEYHSLLYFSKTIKVCCLAETINFFCSLHSKDFNVFCQDYHSLLYFSKTIKVCCLAETINVFCSLHFQRLSESFVETPMSPLLFKTSRSFVWCTWYLLHSFFWQVSLLGFFANSRSDGKIARMKLVSISLLTFSFSIKR